MSTFNYESNNISKDLIKVLRKCYPNNKFSLDIKKTIYLLINSLQNGEIYFDIYEHFNNLETSHNSVTEYLDVMKNDGWIGHKLSPIILEGRNLSLARWHYELQEVIKSLTNKISSLDIKKTKYKIPKEKNLFLNKEQLDAVIAINKYNLILLSGGPGTGKTSTIIEMISNVLSLYPRLRIGLTAPTGKATRRLKDTFQDNINRADDMFKNNLKNIPCKTIHSWLEAKPNGFGKNKKSPLSLDLLVIDEMSMVDLILFKSILEALPQKAKLILVGDFNQLPPIQCGAIWSELHRKEINFIFKKNSIHLNKLYRNRGDLAIIAKELNDFGQDIFWKKISNLNSYSNIKLFKTSQFNIPKNVILQLYTQRKILEKLAQEFRTYITPNESFDPGSYSEVCEKTNEIFKTLESFLLLCPTRFGPWGIDHIHRTLLGTNFENGPNCWPEGTPVICAQNQQDLGLSNGDIGLIIGKGENLRILFRIFSDELELVPKLFSPSRIRHLSPAFALTIHKSQGSESNKVILLWPSDTEQSLSFFKSTNNSDDFEKRLLYTAITRAKNTLEINVSKEFLKSKLS